MVAIDGQSSARPPDGGLPGGRDETRAASATLAHGLNLIEKTVPAHLDVHRRGDHARR
jgi:hypothetical protein